MGFPRWWEEDRGPGTQDQWGREAYRRQKKREQELGVPKWWEEDGGQEPMSN